MNDDHITREANAILKAFQTGDWAEALRLGEETAQRQRTTAERIQELAQHELRLNP